MKGLGAWLSDRLGVPSELRGNPEFQSAVVRITVCLLGSLYIGLGAWTQYYRIDIPYYLTVSVLYLISTLGILLSVIRRPEWLARRYLAVCLDLVVVSLAIFITRDAISPFYLLYILIFISAGTRFGKDLLVVASVVAVVAYNFVLIALDEWHRHTFEAAFFLLLLALLPLYQAALLRQIQRAREEAVRANAAKGRFLAFMTHELRTPLTGVLGMAELLKGTHLDAEQHEYVQAIAGSATTLNALIGDILDFSKIDAGRLTLEHIPFEPRALVREVCASLGGQALAGGLELICEIAPEVPRQVTGDQLRVRQTLLNLLGNAVKFTERGQVLVRLGVRPPEATLTCPHLLLEVVDTGIGIPRDKLPSLFESFRQADDSTTRRFGGSGLGTAIARELALLMGGTIGVESEDGQGSRFWVRLPLLGETPPTPAVESVARLHGLSALVVERNPAQRALIGEILGRARVHCRGVAEPGEIGSAGLDADIPDVVVLADAPDGRDMAAALARIRSVLGPRIPCLLLTYAGRRLTGSPTDAAFLHKPFLAEGLLDRVETLLGRASPESRDGSSCRDESSSALDCRAPRPVRDIRVLVAEDNEIAAKVITTFLTKMGFAHRLMRDGEAALDAALSGGFQIAIVDLRMPKLDGIGFARRYRELAPERPLPIVALTANAAEETKRDCLAAGMDGFLIKPVSPEELRRTVERFVD